MTIRGRPVLPSEMKTFSDVEASYIAGIFDGEGTVGIQKLPSGHLQAKISVTSTDEELIDWLINITGIGRKSKVKEESPRKDIFRWVVYRRKDVKELGKRILPYLQIQRRVNKLTETARTMEAYLYPRAY